MKELREIQEFLGKSDFSSCSWELNRLKVSTCLHPPVQIKTVTCHYSFQIPTAETSKNPNKSTVSYAKIIMLWHIYFDETLEKNIYVNRISGVGIDRLSAFGIFGNFSFKFRFKWRPSRWKEWKMNKEGNIINGVHISSFLGLNWVFLRLLKRKILNEALWRLFLGLKWAFLGFYTLLKGKIWKKTPYRMLFVVELWIFGS